MRTAVLAAGIGLAIAAAGGCSHGPPANPSGFRALFQQGQAIDAFIASADFHKREWQTAYRGAAVPDSTLARARAVPGTWRLLVVAADWCPDSYHVVPHLAKLAEEVPGLELRIVNTGPGKAVMDAYRTPDGRAATPTVLILDDAFHEQGCMIERPTAAERLFLSRKAQGDNNAEAHQAVTAWYERDRGRSAVAEIVSRLAAASAGQPVCAARGGR